MMQVPTNSTRKLIGHDGCEQSFCTKLSIQQIKGKLSASSLQALSLDTLIMFWDDAATIKELPVNEDAMEFARQCGWLSTDKICGNVLVVPETDFYSY